MPRKKAKRRRADRAKLAPWFVLAGSLSIIGFACSHKPLMPSGVRTHAAAQPTARATPLAAATPGVSSHTPTAAPIRAADLPTPALAPGASAASPSGTTAPAATPIVPSPSATSAGATPAPAATSAAGNARLAIIIDDCGQWPTIERGFIALPVRLTLSILPDVRYNHAIESAASAADQGVMLHLPMETLSGLDPGPGRVTTGMNDAAIAAQVERDLVDVDLARGVNNHEGSKATQDTRVMTDVMAVLARRERFFIDSRTSGASVAGAVAQAHHVATAGRDVFLDNRADVAYTEDQLRAAAAIAKRAGTAIAIGHPRPTTLTALRTLIPELQAEGITFVLASDLTR